MSRRASVVWPAVGSTTMSEQGGKSSRAAMSSGGAAASSSPRSSPTHECTSRKEGPCATANTPVSCSRGGTVSGCWHCCCNSCHARGSAGTKRTGGRWMSRQLDMPLPKTLSSGTHPGCGGVARLPAS